MGDKANILVGVVEVEIDGELETSGGLKEADALPLTDFYTVDGVQMIVTSDTFSVKVEEVVGPLKRKLIDQEIKVTLNIAEATLANLCAAIPGSAIDDESTEITLGGGALQEFSLVMTGEGPDGVVRTISLTKVNPIGEVGLVYKKGAITAVPVTFACLVGNDGVFGSISDSGGPM